MPRNQPSDFSKSELKTLVKAIIKVDGYSRTRDRALYRDLYEDMILDQKRSASAMQLAFQEQISSNIYSLCSVKEAKKFEAHLYHEDIVAAKKNFQKQMSNDADSDDAEYFSNNDRESSVSSEENLPRKRRVPVAKGVAAKKMKTVQFSSGTKQKEKKNTQWNEQSEFSIGAVLSGKRKIDECGDKLLSTLDDYPSNPAKERSTRGAVNAKKQNMHPSVVLVDIETQSKAETSKKSVNSAISINQILSGRAKIDLVGNSLIENTFPEDDGKITDYEDNDNDDVQNDAALPKSPSKGKTVIQEISDDDEANFSDEEAPNGASPVKKIMKEKSASPRKPARASPEDNSDDPTIRSSDLHSASSNSSKESADKEASTDEETIVETFIADKKKTSSKKPQASSKSEKSPSKRKPKTVTPSDESDTEVEPAAESSSKGSNLPMIAVAENVQGRKCYFRLVPMTNDEVNAIEGICIPYKLM